MKYSAEYSCASFSGSLSVVVTLESTSSSHTFLVSSLTSDSFVPFGISLWTLLQACSVDINETPTLDCTTLSLNEKMAPTRFNEKSTSPSSVIFSSSLFVGSVPRKVLKVAGLSKCPQKYTLHLGDL